MLAKLILKPEFIVSIFRKCISIGDLISRNVSKFWQQNKTEEGDLIYVMVMLFYFIDIKEFCKILHKNTWIMVYYVNQ